MASRFMLSMLVSVLLFHAVSGQAAGAAHSLLMTQVPPAVTDGQAHFIAPLSAKKQLKLAINLPLRNQAALNTLLQQLYDPHSPNYHHYLSVAEFTDRFSPSQADYDTVVNWAKTQGFAVTTTPNRHLVDIDGSVATIDRALHVNMGSYQHPTENRQFRAPDREPTLDMAVPVLAITGLDNFTLPQPMLKHGTPVPNSTGSGPGGEFLPSDMRAAYYGSGPLTGAGQTVGITSFDGYLWSDVQLYYTRTGMTSNVPVNNVLAGGFDGSCDGGGAACSDGEQVLDIVNVIGMAPGITQILFYESQSGPDMLNQMATDNIAKVLSSSWSSSDMGHNADPIFEEFQAQGQTYANAVGDHRSYNAGNFLPPATNPLILQVGGTDLTTNGPGGTWASETAWTDSGGGFYAPGGYAIPDYQQLPGVINASNNGSTTWRNDPDVAAEANFDNPTVSNGQFLTGYGGTSFATPRWAGFMALANEQSIANGGAPLGFVNPTVYNTGLGTDYANDFHDIISGSNGGFHAVANYDLVTGWGSPVGPPLVGAFSGSTTTPGFVLAAYPLNPSMTQGSSVTSAITVNPLNGFANAVDLTVSGLPSGVTAVFSPPSTTGDSTLTFTSSGTATIGTAAITITGTSGALTQTTSVNLLVGNAPEATVTPNPVVFSAVVPLGSQSQTLSIANAANSILLTYSVAADAGTDGSCSGGPVTWMTASGSGTVAGGQSGGAVVAVTPAAGSLTPGVYAAEICVTTNDPMQPTIVVPVSVIVVQGPQAETIFQSGFESGETGGTNVVTFTIDQPVAESVAGSALDLATGNYHAFDSTVDNINPYSDGTGFSVYWYNDLVPPQFANEVGGVMDVTGLNYAVLQAGAIIGPDSTFSNSVSEMNSWWGGTDGYVGIAFLNSQTQQLNYGYIHFTTTGPAGFPAQLLDYGFDNTGAAVEIP
jgi:subtilase family serine protease